MIHKFQSQSKPWVPFLGFVFYRGIDIPLKNLNIIKPHNSNTTKHKIKHHKILTNLCCTRTCAPICHHSILFKLALFFVCFSYLSHNIPYHSISSLKFAVLILNKTFRRGKAQIMHKKWNINIMNGASIKYKTKHAKHPTPSLQNRSPSNLPPSKQNTKIQKNASTKSLPRKLGSFKMHFFVFYDAQCCIL